MENYNRKEHWQKIYSRDVAGKSGWYQETPDTSLEFIDLLDLPEDAKIIDVGGGESRLVDHLLDRGYRDITVLDISEKAIEKVRQRLGERAERVKWVVCDIVDFHPEENYDCWHDRAAFHFLLDEKDICAYLRIAGTSIRPGGFMVIGTFSEQGPEKCSGVDVRQYSEKKMTARLNGSFEKMKCIRLDHQTPSGNLQNYLFCGFRRKKSDV